MAAPAAEIRQLIRQLGTKGVRLGQLAIVAPGPVSILSPQQAAMVSTRALLINRSPGVRLVLATAIHSPTVAAAPVVQPSASWGPVSLLPGGMAILPAPPAHDLWVLSDLTSRNTAVAITSATWVQWLTLGVTVAAAGGVVIEGVRLVRRAHAKRGRSG